MRQGAVVQRILQLGGRCKVWHLGGLQMVRGGELAALRRAELGPINASRQLGLLVCKCSLETLQLGVERQAQHVRRSVQQRAHRVGVSQQRAVVAHGIGVHLEFGAGAERFGMLQQADEL